MDRGRGKKGFDEQGLYLIDLQQIFKEMGDAFGEVFLEARHMTPFLLLRYILHLG